MGSAESTARALRSSASPAISTGDLGKSSSEFLSALPSPSFNLLAVSTVFSRATELAFSASNVSSRATDFAFLSSNVSSRVFES